MCERLSEFAGARPHLHLAQRPAECLCFRGCAGGGLQAGALLASSASPPASIKKKASKYFKVKTETLVLAVKIKT